MKKLQSGYYRQIIRIRFTGRPGAFSLNVPEAVIAEPRNPDLFLTPFQGIGEIVWFPACLLNNMDVITDKFTGNEPDYLSLFTPDFQPDNPGCILIKIIDTDAIILQVISLGSNTSMTLSG